MKLKKPSYKRNYLSYDLMLDLTTCLHRMVKSAEETPAHHLPLEHQKRTDLPDDSYHTIARSRGRRSAAMSATVTRRSRAVSAFGRAFPATQRCSATSSSVLASRTMLTNCPAEIPNASRTAALKVLSRPI